MTVLPANPSSPKAFLELFLDRFYSDESDQDIINSVLNHPEYKENEEGRKYLAAMKVDPRVVPFFIKMMNAHSFFKKIMELLDDGIETSKALQEMYKKWGATNPTEGAKFPGKVDMDCPDSMTETILKDFHNMFGLPQENYTTKINPDAERDPLRKIIEGLNELAN